MRMWGLEAVRRGVEMEMEPEPEWMSSTAGLGDVAEAFLGTTSMLMVPL